MVKEVKWVSTRNTLDSFRNNGITTEEGICELIDNSIDARASKIKIMLEEVSKDVYIYTIIDNGCGIPTSFEDPEDPEGLKLQGIRYALSVGGKMNIYGTKKIGRFGWGLSSTVAELSSKTDVYSKCDDDQEWRYSFYDYKWLDENNLVIPEEITKTPPLLALPEGTGTIIRLTVKRSKRLQLKRLQQRLVKRIGQFYSSMIGPSLSIIISQKTLKGKWQDTEVMPNDFLWKSEKSRNVIDYGKSIPKGEVSIEINADHDLADAIETEIQFPLTIRIELALIDAEKISKKSGLKPEVGFGEWAKLMGKVGIGLDTQGFALSRNGRIIDVGKDIGYSKIAPLNFFRAVVHFPSELDQLFGIQNNKNKSRIYEPLQNLIGSKCNATIKQIRSDHQNTMRRIRTKPVNRTQNAPMAEVHVGKIHDILPRVKITPKQRESGAQKLKQLVELTRNEILLETEKQISEQQIQLDEAVKNGRKEKVSELKKTIEEITIKMEQDIKDVEERFSENSGRLVQFSPMSPKPIGTGEIYNIESYGDVALVTLNSESTFFHNVYARASMKKWDKFLLDLMIFSMAYSEHIARSDIGNSSRALHWAENRRDISTMVHRFIDPISKEQPVETCMICGGENCECL